MAVAAAVSAGSHILNYVEKVAVPGAPTWFVPEHVQPGAYAGPAAATLRITTDKAQTKKLIRSLGIPTPNGVLALSDTPEVLARLTQLSAPLLLKPNAEAGSVGITDASVVESSIEAAAALRSQLRSFPAGVLVEEYIAGHDVTVALLETAAGFRCLPLVKYLPQQLQASRFGMYDYPAKNDPRFIMAQTQMVHAECPARLDRALQSQIERYSLAAVAATELRAFARVDFRVTPDGEPFFLEINSLPDLDPTSGFFMALRTARLELGTLARGLVAAYPALRDDK